MALEKLEDEVLFFSPFFVRGGGFIAGFRGREGCVVNCMWRKRIIEWVP